MVKFVTSMAEFEALKAEDKLLVVDFTASWCGPCRFIAPTFAKLAEENPDANFIKVDVDDAEEIAAACQIQSMPTFQFYKSGKMIHSFSGASPPMLTAKVAELK